MAKVKLVNGQDFTVNFKDGVVNFTKDIEQEVSQELADYLSNNAQFEVLETSTKSKSDKSDELVLDDMSKSELSKLADELGVTVKKKAKKEDLLEAIKEVQ